MDVTARTLVQIWRAATNRFDHLWLNTLTPYRRRARRCLASGVIVVLAAFFVIVAPALFSPEGASAASSGSPSEFGNHFILLVDDSHDMHSYKDLIKVSLMELLFDQKIAGQAIDAALPRFQADRDQVSVVFFTVFGGTEYRGCAGTQKGSSVMPNDMFVLEAVDSRTRASFAASLESQLDKPCRFGGMLSPIATAHSLILPYLQGKLPPNKLFSRTIIIEATNEFYNTPASPAAELANYQRSFDVAGTEEAVEISHQVATNFHFDSAPRWKSAIGSLHLNISEVVPLHSADTVLSYQRKIQMDRQAVSSDKLLLVPETPHAGDLHIISGASSAYRFRPVFMQLNFQGTAGGPWKWGKHTAPQDLSVNLTPCRSPNCVDEGNRISIPLLTAGDNLYLSPEDLEPAAGKINFTIGFSYETGVYDHLFVKSSEQHIDVTPTQRAVTSGAFGIFPNIRLTNRELAALWRSDADGITTQIEAIDRLRARHNWYWVFLLLLVVALVAALIFYLYRTKYQRSFKPRLQWRPTRKVIVDFNRPAASHVLVGRLDVVNEEQVPWFGRLWHNEEQPTRDAVFTLTYDFFNESGLELTSPSPIGFIRGSHGNEEHCKLHLSTNEVVSHRKTIFLFLATDSLIDYRHQSGNGAHAVDKNFTIDLLVNMTWGQNGEMEAERNPLVNRLSSFLGGKEHGTVVLAMQCDLTLKPEQERKPLVSYLPSPEGKLVFKEGGKIQVGKFIFESQAEHLFAAPFVWGDYVLQVYRGNELLAGEPIRLARPRLILQPKAKTEVPVLLDCDGRVVTNPEPVSHAYTFKIMGNVDPSSEIKQQTATIWRDDARAEIVLEILHPEPAREIYWTREGRPEQRVLAHDGTEKGKLPVEDETIWLDAQHFQFDATDNGPYDLLKVEIGNSAASGNGFVDVQVTAIVRDEEVSGAIHLSDGRQIDELLGVYDVDERSARIHIKEGENCQTRSVRFFAGLITHIDGAVVSDAKLRMEVRLGIHVRSDQGEDTQRELRLIIPLGLEQMPSPNWLCIDYGTSAIAAAFGSGEEEQILPIPLQEITGKDDISLATYDVDNMERGNRFLLPSWIICDADIRDTARVYKITRPGFPEYIPPSLKPGDPAFITLPAPSPRFATDPGRIIYSIKSWLGQSAANVSLDTPIKYENDDHQEVSGTSLPLDKLVESSFAALIEGYLLANGADYRADQIIICHPNTFTRNHQQKLREIAFRAFSRRFGIQRIERVHLISESDAVAYYYCRRQMRENRCEGTERLLVYDFGAGTLDLSLILIEWNKAPYCYPARWKVEARIGVPVAGNYLDETLARLIDRLLRERLVNKIDHRLKYTYPIVGRSLVSGKDFEHRKAIKNLWQALKKAKHAWNGTDPFTVEVGTEKGEEGGVVTGIGGETERETLPKAPPPPDQIGLWVKEGYVYLSIPATEIRGDERLKEFHGFVTETVIDELLHAADVSADKVNTVVVSGRGALWPALRDDVLGKFSGAEHADLLRGGTMKSAVVQGAIARQDLNIDFEEAEDESTFKPKLGVLINNDQDIITEDDWDKPIDLSRSPTFRVVQVNLKDPNPRVDLKSLRKHFYVDVDGKVYRRRNNQIHVRHDEKRKGKFMLYIQDANGLRPVIGDGGSQAITSAPWPVGSFLLGPEPIPGE